MRAKKSLGQNWLVDPTVVATIIETAALRPNEVVLEIGPGQGVLTTALLATGARVLAIEKDDRLIDVLNRKFAVARERKQFTLIHGDVLDFLPQPHEVLAGGYQLVANIPYYLTGRILRQFLTNEPQPKTVTVLLQKEVAKRLVAKDGRESLLSMATKVYGRPRYVQTVPAAAFSPQPKVDSAIVSIDQINKDNFRASSEEKFFDCLKRGFAGKRKMLRNNLALAPNVWSSCQIAPTARAENLTLNDWLCLAEKS